MLGYKHWNSQPDHRYLKFIHLQIYGLTIDALQILQSHFKFTVDYHLTSSYGELAPNGTLIGVKGEVRLADCQCTADLNMKQNCTSIVCTSC